MVSVFTDCSNYCIKSKLNVYFGGFTEGHMRMSREEGAGLQVPGWERGIFGMHRGVRMLVGPK